MERRRGPAERPNPGEPSTPRPSASIALLRRGGRHGDRALEVLMLKRTEEARFMPGVWVFPGGTVDPGDGVAGEESAHRTCAVRELREEAGIALPPEEELVPFARWITPEAIARRFDAWFFLALAPAHTPPEPDGVEVTDAGWMEPGAALEAEEAGELSLAFPTIQQLRALLPFRTSREAIEAFRGRAVEPILPKVVGAGEESRIALPGDPDYD